MACLFVAEAVGTTAVLAGGATSDKGYADRLIVRKANGNQDDAGAKKVADAPPGVVKTVPAAGAEDLGRGAALPSGDNKPVFDKD